MSLDTQYSHWYSLSLFVYSFVTLQDSVCRQDVFVSIEWHRLYAVLLKSNRKTNKVYTTDSRDHTTGSDNKFYYNKDSSKILEAIQGF